MTSPLCDLITPDAVRGAAPQQQGVVQFGERLTRVPVQMADSRPEEPLLVGAGDLPVAVSPVAQIGEVPKQPAQVVRESAVMVIIIQSQ